MRVLRFWVTRNSRTSFRAETLIFFALTVGILRGFLESFLFGIDLHGSDILGFVPFYFSLPFIYAALLSTISGITYSRVLQPVTFATLLGILPPILDYCLSSGQVHSVFYGYYLHHDYRNFPWLGYAPPQSYPLGEAITIWLTIILAAFYVYLKTSNFFRTLLAVMAAYSAYLVYSLLIPSILAYMLFGHLAGLHELAQKGTARLRAALFFMGVFQILIAITLTSLYSGIWRFFMRRFFHLLPFVLLTILGTVISGADKENLLVSMIVTVVTGFVVIAQNDVLDTGNRNLIGEYTLNTINIGAIVVYGMLLFAGYKVALLGLVNFSLSMLYHYPFFNIRKTLYGSMKVEGLWALLSFLIGIFSGYREFPHRKSIAYAAIIFGGFSLFSVLKDAKDFASDKSEGRRTIYTNFASTAGILRRINLGLAALVTLSLITVGLMHFSTPGTIYAHLILSVIAGLTVMRIERKAVFQLFMIVVCGLIVNAVIHERL
jgi:hypothetical protein